MKTLLNLEEAAEFALGLALFLQLEYAWWWFPVLLLAPDIGMIGYLMNSKIGAFSYNLTHHKAVAITFILVGLFVLTDIYTAIGAIMLAHSAMDRIFGYGLKYSDRFQHTHLGEIGNN
ncbi:DUF4260 domain-containing protein [Flavobacteriaceae bacterium TK19130]|nr:DUF4260 domain-containing protein [Thermobacterium salinum]